MGRNALDSAHIDERAVLTASPAAFSVEMIPGCAGGPTFQPGASRRAPARLCGPKPAVVNGDSRSLTNTKGEDGLSRWDRAAPAVRRPVSVQARGAVLEPEVVRYHAGEVDLV